MNRERVSITIRGAVQGVGFRPFVYRLATELALQGWVRNSAQGVAIEAEGPREILDSFLSRLETEQPPHATIQGLKFAFLEAAGCVAFEIHESESVGGKSTLVLPDIATCTDCLRELSDPQNRRYRYPFVNCTHCGPRFSIIEALPYDRSNTSMKKFTMCRLCMSEYRDPRDRRFHAQPNACPECGPQLEFSDGAGRTLAVRDEALLRAAEALRAGQILAVKGLGGFQLMVDARNNDAMQRLRTRKRREEKPFATMYPSFDAVERDCVVSAFEKQLLNSSEAPIVLLDRKSEKSQIAPEVAPGNPALGIMLPYTPLHHLLMKELGFPVVATSGNHSDEPICIDESEALARLNGIADLYLVHDRPIARHADDSVTRVILGREFMLRRARGYAPLPVQLREEIPTILGLGAHAKSTIALSVGRVVFVSQHIGDLETPLAFNAFRKATEDFRHLYDARPEVVAHDLHPEYLSTKFAGELGVKLSGVQHHYAHILACMAENELEAPVLGVAWDGSGFGLDGTIWGGEFLHVNDESFERVAHLRPFRLPGGATAVREPRRAALGLLYEMLGDAVFEGSEFAPLRTFTGAEISVLRRALPRRINSPLTSSAGRLFDAVASLLGVRQYASFEGQAAMELEWTVKNGTETAYPIEGGSVIDWEPAIRELLHDDAPLGIKAAKFHNTLVEVIVGVAIRVGEENVALSGGCFQNRYLLQRAVGRLGAEGFHPYRHQRIPTNDGGIALGQVLGAAREYRRASAAIPGVPAAARA